MKSKKFFTKDVSSNAPLNREEIRTGQKSETTLRERREIKKAAKAAEQYQAFLNRPVGAPGSTSYPFEDIPAEDIAQLSPREKQQAFNSEVDKIAEERTLWIAAGKSLSHFDEETRKRLDAFRTKYGM